MIELVVFGGATAVAALVSYLLVSALRELGL